MAFSFSNVGSAATGDGQVSQGPNLPEVQTEGLGFLSLAGDAKLRLTSPWSPPPPAYASLLSIASRQGLVAAACPDGVVLASTEAVRKAFEGPKDGDNDVRPFQPQLELPLPIRICQLAFTADESYLILSAEQGGGLAVYDVQALQQGTTQTAFEIPTNGESLRALVPNPGPDHGELCAVVTSEGKLLMANMKERNFTPGLNGQVLKEQVSCVAWSTKGKQLVAGLGDGAMHQMTPKGDLRAEIPRPPDLNPISTVVWLENDVFLVFHVSTSEGSPQTKCHLITRQGQNFQYQKLNNPVDPFGTDKIPHHTAARLKDFPPNLQDLLIFSSTAVPDIGLLARSKTPLSSDGPANVFTNIELADDSKRATLPMGDGMESPVPIGTALDLSSKDKVYKPIPTDELDQSPGPLPGYWVLNDQGVLSVWWVVYSESIRGGTTYPGLAAVKGNTTTSAPSIASQPAQPSPFGAPSSSSAFGAPTAPTPAFGGPSALGTRSSPWGAQPSSSSGAASSAFGSSSFGTGATASAPKLGTPAFGAPSFGTTSEKAPAPAFGQPAGLGTRASPWASGSAASTTPAFGQSGFAKSPAGPSGLFGASSNNATSSSGFAGFASKGGFASLGADTNATGSSIFTSTKSDAPEVSMETDSNTSFPPPSSRPAIGTGNPFGSQPFKLTSSFQRGPNAKDEDEAKIDLKSSAGDKSMFGTSFTSTMNELTKPGTSTSQSAAHSIFGQPAPTSNIESTTPTTTPTPSKFLTETTPAPKSGGIFSFPQKSPGGLFGSSTSQTPKAEAPQIKTEPETPRPAETIADVPLPPESTSKATYPFGDSSSSSATTADTVDVKITPPKTEAPSFPSDFLPSKTKMESEPPTRAPLAAASEAPLPPDPVKNKKAYNAPLPPLPGTASKSKPDDGVPLPPDPVKKKKAYATELPPLPGAGAASRTKLPSDAPLPPDPVKQSKVYENKVPALPIAKPVSTVAGPGFKFPTNPLPVLSDSDDDDLSEEEEGTEAASEGSGVDVAKELSPSTIGANKTPGFTPQSSFDGLAGSYSTISRPDQDRRNVFGELGRNVPHFPQPNPVSPRSPSPVRGALPARMMGNEQSRSFSAPGMASQILGASRKPQSRLGASIVGKDTFIEDAIIEQQRKAKAKKEAEETQLLIDEEDDAVQQLLKTDVEPTLDLDEFIAHSGVAPPAGDSVPAQVEAVYRDINSMIDTLGLNARSLAGFIKGHKQLRPDHRTRQDLNSSEDWTLAEVEGLTDIIDQDLGEALDEARIIDVEEKLAQIQDLQREVVRDRNKQADLKKIIAARFDPEQAVANRGLPLSSEQAAQQSDLRRELAKFMKLLAETEENLTLLKARIVSASNANGKGGPTPTIEAVVRTITKMTSMVEKRSGDIDVLENQMRKLRLGSVGPTGSREGSPFATPNAKRSSMIFSPERSIRDASTPQRGSVIRHSLSASVTSNSGGMFRTPPRKKLSGFGDAERKAVKEKRERRAAVLGNLKSSLEKKGVSVWGVDDIE
ncbi:hypothetical protein F5X99DRAFT_407334 [Biscogniauxia marginata]|nr:hypothetical protein F5X99DRAFT_407334 [Biscogniauxia marginata]